MIRVSVATRRAIATRWPRAAFAGNEADICRGAAERDAYADFTPARATRYARRRTAHRRQQHRRAAEAVRTIMLKRRGALTVESSCRASTPREGCSG